MHTDGFVASRYPFFPSLCPVKHFSCFLYHLVGNRSQIALASPWLRGGRATKLTGFPPSTFESSKDWEEELGACSSLLNEIVSSHLNLSTVFVSALLNRSWETCVPVTPSYFIGTFILVV